jgi:CheY-like chemotaxis protein
VEKATAHTDLSLKQYSSGVRTGNAYSYYVNNGDYMFLRKLNIKTQPVPTMERRFTTLIVDDDDFVVKSMPSFLARIPSVDVVGTARDGMDALEKLKISQPNVVLMDVRMPRMGGIEATEHIIKKYPGVRVVLMSGFDDNGMREECKIAGAHGFMAKLNVTVEFPILLRQIFAATESE